jgi:hypothetical protein
MNTLDKSYVDGFDDVDKQIEIFENWKNYVEEIIDIAGWLGPSKTSAYAIMNFDSDIEIADLACGPGTGGKILKSSHYNNVDGYDITPTFMNIAKTYYRSVDYCNILQTPLPKKYPVILASGLFTKGHLSAAPAKNIADSLTDDGVFVMTNPAMSDYDYMKESGWDSQRYLRVVETFGPWKSLVTDGHQHYHYLRVLKKA